MLQKYETKQKGLFTKHDIRLEMRTSSITKAEG